MKTKTPTPNIFEAKLSSGVNVDFKSATASTQREFSGVANSGLPFSHFGTLTVIDFDNIQFKPVVAILHEHEHRAGMGTLSVDNEKGLLVAGKLLSSEWGQSVANDSDEGFPWEMSVYVIVSSFEELQAGAKATINGNEVSGPLMIWRNCTVREVSFTAVGVDPNTSAKALSGLLPQFSNSEEQQTMTPEEQAQFDDLKKEVADLKKANADLQTANDALTTEKEEAQKAAQEAEVDAQLSAAGFKRSEDGKGFAGVSGATYGALLSAKPADAKAMIADLQPHTSKPAVPGILLSDQTLHNQPAGTALSGLEADALARKNTGASYV